MKKCVLMIIALTSFSALSMTGDLVPQANFKFDGDVYRSELKQMAVDGHTPGHSYSKARRMIMQNIHLRSDEVGYFVKDVYCRRNYRKRVGPNDMPNHEQINIEHTWPRSRFGLKKGSPAFRVREADLHHLYPTNSKANSTRSNLYFGEFPKTSGLRDCAASKRGIIKATNRFGFEPPAEHKGNVARAIFYFSVRYDSKIPAYEEFLLRQWNIVDPVDAEELDRNDGVEKLQGNRNPFIDDAALVSLIQDY
jgi:deoxyribonuclease-1